MIVEQHILQNFAPANLNRDDTGAPKDCTFGGVRRARISSQCFKRAIRTEFRDSGLLTADALSHRTRRFVDELAQRLAAYPPLRDQQITAESARPVAVALLNALGLKVVKDYKTEYLLFLAESEIQALTELAAQYWPQLHDAVVTAQATEQEPQQEGSQQSPQQQSQQQQRGSKAKADKEPQLPREVKQALLSRLDGASAADLALFGRMIANLPEKNVEAACQVAHAISTNRVEVEFDFYTAVDDLRPQDTAGADMLGTLEFNSACFYRYASVDTTQLLHNLGGDGDLAQRALAAFLRASVEAVPTGKQHSMAAYNPPSLVMLVARARGQWSLANAFLRPVRPYGDQDLMRGSIAALDDYWARLTGMYGDEGIAGVWLATTESEPEALPHLDTYRQPSVTHVISSALAVTALPALSETGSTTAATAEAEARATARGRSR